MDDKCDPITSSGLICLSKDQIIYTSSTPQESTSVGQSQDVSGGFNMLYTFLMALRSPKKCCSDQLMFVLKKYGFSKQADKEQYVLMW